MNDRATVVAESDAAEDAIPLDLAPLLTPYRQHRRLSLRVVHLPARSELTHGVKNEDASWSLAPEDLEGLALLLPDDSEPPPSVAVRIVVIDKNENASIVGQFEVPLPRRALPARKKGGTGPAQAMPEDWQRRMDRRVAAAQRLGRRKAALALAQAEAGWRAESEARLAEQARQVEQDWQEKVVAERAAREAAEAGLAEAAQKEAALSQELEAALARVAATEAAAGQAGSVERQAEEVEARLAQELDARLAAARSDWDRESEARLAAAVAQAVRSAEAAAAASFEEARASWQQDNKRELDAAQRRCAEAESAARQLETRLAEAEAQWQTDSETRLANQEQVLELAWRQKIEAERNARRAAERKAEEAAQAVSTLSGEREAALARAAAAEAAAARLASERQQRSEGDEAHQAQQLATRIAAARSAWHRESEARLAAAVEEAVRKAEATAEARHREAREAWERESQAALAVAEGKWRAEAAKRLATAQAEWMRTAQANAATGRRTLRSVARRQWRPHAWRRLRQVCVVAGCVVAALFLYPSVKPVLWMWTPKIVALAGDLGAAARAELQSLAAELAERL